MSNPFVIDISRVQTGLTESVDLSGPSPVRWGGNMLAVEEGTIVDLHGSVSNLGEAIMIDAHVAAAATGTCSLCLQDITTTFDYSITDVFGLTPDFIGGDADEDGELDDPLLVEDGCIDVTQLVLDEAGLNVPFSPVCADYGQQCGQETPSPAGTVDGAMAVGGQSARPDAVNEDGEVNPDLVDPRWAALRNFTVDE